MPACTFIGHRDCPDTILPELKKVLTDIIENKEADTFYVGDNGNFDACVYKVLRELEKSYDFKFFVVLPYLKNRHNKENTIYPEGLETVPKRFAIHHRNMWMIDKADILVSYATSSFSNSYKYTQIASKRGLKILSLK